MRKMTAAVVAATLAVGGSGLSAAADDECDQVLISVPIEETVLPEGWAWSNLAHGAAFGLTSWVGQIGLTDPDEYGGISIVLTCSAVAAQLVPRTAEIQSTLFDFDKLGVVPIGDTTSALRGPEGDITIQWANGELLGSVGGDAEDYEAIEAVAIAIDALLP